MPNHLPMEGSHTDALADFGSLFVNRPCKSVFQGISVDPTFNVEAFDKEKATSILNIIIVCVCSSHAVPQHSCPIVVSDYLHSG